jgi:hypothetical protein
MQKELKRLWELDAVSPDFQAELEKIHHAKSRAVLGAWWRLLMSKPTLIAYERAKDERQPFLPFKEKTERELLEEVGKLLEKNREARELAATILAGGKAINNHIISAWQRSVPFSDHWEGSIMAALDSLADIDYIPPEDPSDLLTHLWALLSYHQNFLNFPPTLVDMRFDLSLAKLMAAVENVCAGDRFHGERESGRTKKSAQVKKARADQRKRIISAIYDHSGKIIPGMKLNKVFAKIRSEFDELKKKSEAEKTYFGIIPRDMEKPSSDTIKRWFREDGILERDFKLVGRYWIKQT